MATPPMQQLRSASAGIHPPSLEPGQIAFNMSDSAMYVGNGGNANQLADPAATPAPPVPPAGKGWIQFRLKIADIAALLLGGATPTVVGDSRSFGTPVVPTPGQFLAWDATANGGKGGYVPKTPGAVKVMSLVKADADAGGPGSVTQALVKALTTAGKITAVADLHAGDQIIISDDGTTGSLVDPGAYVFDGTTFTGLPSGGGAKVMSELTNVAPAPALVPADKIGGFLVRDLTVVNEVDAGAWKVANVIDGGVY